MVADLAGKGALEFVGAVLGGDVDRRLGGIQAVAQVNGRRRNNHIDLRQAAKRAKGGCWSER